MKRYLRQHTFTHDTRHRLMIALVELIDPAGSKPYAVEVDAYMVSEDGTAITGTPRSSVTRKFETLLDATKHLQKRIRKLKGWKPLL